MAFELAYNGNDDILDSRDLYMRQDELETLESDRDDATAEYEEALENFENDEGTQEAVTLALENLKSAQDAFTDIEREELDILRAAEKEIDGYMHGVTLIHDSYFKNYARDYARDVTGYTTDDNAWPLNCIDWDAAAEQLQSDFTEIMINGETYYYQ